MKKLILFSLVVVLSYSCKHEEDISRALGKATFSLSPQTTLSNGRVNEGVIPAFVLLSIKDSKGILQENIKLPLFAFGQNYLSGNLQLETGTYQLTLFAVLDATNSVIYATPLTGSDLAKYVTYPLPLDFTIGENQNTQVIPQVLAVSNSNSPQSFGLASFGFEIAKVAVVKVPLGGVEGITKVSYQFSNDTKIISSERIDLNSTLDLNIPELLGKTWQTRILAWTKAKDCYQKVYRYNGELTFDGSVLQLPSLETTNWAPFYYVEKDGIGIFRSIDPRGSYRVEVQLPEGVSGYGYVDRSLYNEAGDALCDNRYSDFSNSDALHGLISVSIPDQTSCDVTELGLVDSFFFISLLTQNVIIRNFFYWEVKDSIVKPVCL